MQIKCWNCGTEMEKAGVEEYKASLLKTIKKLEYMIRTSGDELSAENYKDIIYLIENFD